LINDSAGVGAVHFEAIGPRHAGSESDVVEYRANRHDLVVVVDSFDATDRFGE
jgi:hypothetical protein